MPTLEGRPCPFRCPLQGCPTPRPPPAPSPGAAALAHPVGPHVSCVVLRGRALPLPSCCWWWCFSRCWCRHIYVWLRGAPGWRTAAGHRVGGLHGAGVGRAAGQVPCDTAGGDGRYSGEWLKRAGRTKNMRPSSICPTPFSFTLVLSPGAQQGCFVDVHRAVVLCCRRATGGAASGAARCCRPPAALGPTPPPPPPPAPPSRCSSRRVPTAPYACGPWRSACSCSSSSRPLLLLRARWLGVPERTVRVHSLMTQQVATMARE